MPSTPHEAPLELLRQNPRLGAVLLRQAGIPVRDDVTATTGSSDLSIVTTKQFLGDNLTVLSDADGQPIRVTINEPQREPDETKSWSWPVYLTVARPRYRCAATLLAICYDKRTADWARQPIETGHPDFVLRPVVIDATNTPDPDDPALADLAAELVVLAAHTGALDLDDPVARELALSKIAPLDTERLNMYGSFMLNIASESARDALEQLMATAPYKTDFFDRIKASGEAQMLLRHIAKRGVEIDEESRERILACTDMATIEVWDDRAYTARTIAEIFRD
jgi:hypothetical protein